MFKGFYLMHDKIRYIMFDNSYIENKIHTYTCIVDENSTTFKCGGKKDRIGMRIKASLRSRITPRAELNHLEARSRQREGVYPEASRWLQNKMSPPLDSISKFMHSTPSAVCF